ncbi:EAL domain-containing protein [Kineosporia rhizophila]|uniref:EAL domain-containing protein n=1 Tax=Kineosporia rhizophila TaxID=84633 RepID=UPI001E4C849D|nr:EAL domain-containing protein [Kineosporia rhizophila]MCE0540089.1 EAL domain-containing protein [Kineosporia rhizophila]
MQLLGADPGGEGRPTTPGLNSTDLSPAGLAPLTGFAGTGATGTQAGRWGRLRRMGRLSRISRGSRRGARVRLRGRRPVVRTGRPGPIDDHAGLPAPLLTPPLAIATPVLDNPSRDAGCGFDTLTFGPVTRPGGPGEEEADTAEWDLPVSMAIDLSDGPKVIRRPLPPLPPELLKGVPRQAGPERANPDANDQDEQTGPTNPVRAEALVPPQAPTPVTPYAGVNLNPSSPVTHKEPRRVPEALLTLVLSLIASATAWATAATPQVWLALSALPAAGLLALLLPEATVARVLRATALFASAAALAVLDPAMTPVSLTIALATAAFYPLMLSPAGGWLVTALAVVSPTAALIGRTLADGPDRVLRMLGDPQANPAVGPQIALASGILVAGLVGLTTTVTRRRLIGAASAAQTAERQARAEAAALAAASSTDPATGLPNRDGLLRAIALTLTEPDPVTRGSSQPPVGLVLAEIERFDHLADTLGAPLADDLAAQAGLRISKAFADHLVGRVSRHQFAVVLTEDVLTPNADTCADVARSISRQMAEPVLAGRREFTLSCSLGAVISGPGLITADDLLQAADEAVRTARRGGRGRFTMFDRAVRARRRLQAGLENELRQAVLRGSIEVDFQPMLALGSGTDDDDHITGAEARPRWRRPDGTTMPAEDFLPLADELGLGVTLGLQTINRALTALVIWRHEGVGVDQVWVGLTPAQLQDPDFAHEVAAQLAIRGLAASCLTLQIGAGELGESGQALLTLGMLRSLGISVALADFGGGGTSLTMLRRLPISAVKLDARLTAELAEADDVPRAAAQLCHSLGLQVICDAVQTPGQLEGARRIGADAVQGQAIARPMSAQDVTNLLTLRMPRALRLGTES